MAYLNSNDTLLPGTLSYVARFFRDRPDVDIVYGHRIFVNEDGLETGRAVFPPHDAKALQYLGYVPQETMFWRRRVWDKIRPIDQSFRFALDWDFMLRAQQQGFTLVRLPRVSRMLPDSRRAKNIGNDACWIGRDAVASSPAPRSSAEPGRNLSRGCAVSRAAVCVPLAISVEGLEILPLMRILAYPEVQEHSELGGSAQQARWSSVRLHVFDCEASLSMRTGIQA